MLYHYTSVETLYKIFHNTINNDITLRANYFMNMNDPLDCRYLIKEVSQILSKKNKNNSEEEIEKNLEKSMLDVGLPYFISLTELEDSLPMWNMYGGRGHGVAIGFSKDILKKVVTGFQNKGSDKEKAENTSRFCKLYECKYWDKNDIEVKFVNKYNLSINDKNEISGLGYKDVCSISYLIKHPSYEYEKESRVVFLDCPRLNEIKYKDFYIPLEAVKTIVCGPCGDEGLVRTVIQNRHKVCVKKSEIQYTDTPQKIKFRKI